MDKEKAPGGVTQYQVGVSKHPKLVNGTNRQKIKSTYDLTRHLNQHSVLEGLNNSAATQRAL